MIAWFIVEERGHAEGAEGQTKKEEIIPKKEGQLLFLGLFSFLNCIFFDNVLSLLLGELYPSLQRGPISKHPTEQPHFLWPLEIEVFCLLLHNQLNLLLLNHFCFLDLFIQVWFNVS